MTEGAWIEGAKELLMLPSRDQEPITLAFLGDVYRKYLAVLSDRQWLHAVAETMRHEKWFPTVSTLLEYGDQTAPQLTDWTGECGLCEGTGFEPFERDGYAFVRFCPRGCKPHNDKLDGAKPRERRREAEPPFPDAKGILERLEAICREKTAQGLDGFKYHGMPEEKLDADEGQGGRQSRRNHGRPTQRRDSGQVSSPDGQGLS